MFSGLTSEEEVKNCINSLKKKAPGIDGIRAETIQCITANICKPLSSILINKIFNSGYCPTAFKVSIVKPIFKKGDKLEIKNYRPISLITNFAKIFEKLLKKRILSYLNKFQLLSDQQIGFRTGKSAQDAISLLTGKIYSSLDKGKPSLGIFIDLAKAFDTVSHPLLLETLKNIGIRNLPLSLLKSYLDDRKQCVQIGLTKSDFQTIKYGVPQGTILGPLLFIIYLNNLFSVETSGNIFSFADDTVIFYESDSWDNLKLEIENDLKKIIHWFNSKLLTINFDKTVFVPFSCYMSTLPNYKELNILLDENQSISILSTSSVKYLGIYIDSHLKWDIHVNKLINKLRSLLYLFNTLKDILNIDQLKTTYLCNKPGNDTKEVFKIDLQKTNKLRLGYIV